MAEIKTNVCVVGGGPAGLMAGYLLARAGVEVVVIEKHGDFFRDFRGDTVHPSTLELMHELGILDGFLKLPHQKVSQLGGQIGDEKFMMADFSYLNTKCKYIVFMPQWDFLNYIAEQAQKYPKFNLRMNTEAVDLLEENGKVIGVRAIDDNGELLIKSNLVIGADGRGSVVRKSAHMEVEDVGAPMDVLWMRISRKPSDPAETLGRFDAGKILIMINRNEYWQCGFVIPKGKLEEYKIKGLQSIKERIVAMAPFTCDTVDDITSFDDIKLLTVKVDRLSKWYRDGLLCIGDSAHAMSPVAGVGINLAVQDAVAAANFLYMPLLKGNLNESHLRMVQERRTYPTRMTQRAQVLIQNNVIKPALESTEMKAPWFTQVFKTLPPLRALPANLIGMGFRPEHIHSPDTRQQAGVMK
ncbi:MAG: FAD-dependent oxidoreductase [Cyanobacteria bacterium TGS_CYA1]|nr:FAD-dependent oxidoreductase [Cyanobacteria bacterium TGS_CYA1]